MTNCKACNAPLTPNAVACEYCGAVVETTKETVTSVGKFVSPDVSSYLPNNMKSDSYRSQANSIKPQVGAGGVGMHWTTIVSFILSILLFLTSFSAEADKDWITGFIFIAMLSFAFNMSGVKNYSQKNWMVTTNYVLLCLSIVFSFISLT